MMKPPTARVEKSWSSTGSLAVKKVNQRISSFMRTQRKAHFRQVRPVDVALAQLSNDEAAKMIYERLLSSETLVFSTKEKLREHFFSTAWVSSATGSILDFGVMSGDSTLAIAEALGGGPNSKVWGFDAFLGIRDPWSKSDRPAGSMSLEGRVPSALVEHPNVGLVVGWVEDTLGEFLERNPGPVAFAHFDLDVYAPTRFALEAVRPSLNRDAVMVFDDFFGFIGWKNHSARAFFEIFDDSEWVCLAVSPHQAVFKLV
jgi:hypothetical protein